MSHREGKLVVVCEEPEGNCELCGKKAELRPYGPKGEMICYPCGMKSAETTTRVMRKALFGEGENEKEVN